MRGCACQNVGKLGLRQRPKIIPATRPAVDVDSIAEGSTVKGVCEKLHKLLNDR